MCRGGRRSLSGGIAEVPTFAACLSDCSQPDDTPVMSGPVRFVAESALAQVAGAVLGATVFAGDSVGDGYDRAATLSLISQLATVLLQWLVMRRHLPFASQWAFADLVSLPIAIVSSSVYSVLPRTAMFGLAFPVAWATLSEALPAYAVLASRLDRAWRWLVVPGAIAAARTLFNAAVLGTAPMTAGTASPWAYRAVNVAATLITLAILAWSVRDRFDEAGERPVPDTSTRVEFLLGWISMHHLLVGATTALAMFVASDRSLQLPVGIVGFTAMMALGYAAVFSTTREPWRPWAKTVAFVAPVWLVGVVLLTWPVYMVLLASSWMALGLTISAAQWFVIRRWSTGWVWLAAVAVSWTAALWLPRMVHALVGPANAWRYPIGTPPGVYLFPAIATGIALLFEFRRGPVFADSGVRRP